MGKVVNNTHIIHHIQAISNKIKTAINKREYADLSESEKIPLRCLSAEMNALESFLENDDLDFQEKVCVDSELFCGAEGIKNAREWLIKNQYINSLCVVGLFQL